MTLRPTRLRLAMVLCLLPVTVVGCRPQQQKDSSAKPQAAETKKAVLERRELEGLENVWQLTDRITSGSGPDSDQAFASLAEAGIDVVVSVDGTKPHVEMAKKHGLRYIHIPIGYDGVPDAARRALVQLADEVEGNVYIHCHHGKHRGPAAAAIACMADAGIDHAEARRILTTAGTNEKYRGLYRDVAEFDESIIKAKPVKLVEVADVSLMVESMAKIDAANEYLQTLLADNGEPPADQLAADAMEQSLLLLEGFRESVRSLEQDAAEEEREGTSDLKQKMAAASELAEVLHAAVDEEDIAKAKELSAKVAATCSSCHETYRNNR